MTKAGMVPGYAITVILPLMVLAVCSTKVFSQERFNSRDSVIYKFEIEVRTDNDLFVAHSSTDKYYTYGLKLGLRFVPRQLEIFTPIFGRKLILGSGNFCLSHNPWR